MPALFSLNHVAPKQSATLSWHLPSIFLLFPPHHMAKGKKKECMMGANAFIQLEVQLTQCVTTMVDGCTADSVTCHSTIEVQIPIHWQRPPTEGTHCKQINVRLKYQIPYRTKNCIEYNSPTMDKKYSSGVMTLGWWGGLVVGGSNSILKKKKCPVEINIWYERYWSCSHTQIIQDTYFNQYK